MVAGIALFVEALVLVVAGITRTTNSTLGESVADLDARQALLDEARELHDLFKEAAYGSATERFAAHTLAANIVPALMAALEYAPDERKTGFTTE